MNDSTQKIKIVCFVLLNVMILSVSFAAIPEAGTQETAMKMVFGKRSIAMPLPKDRIVVRSSYSYIDTVTRIKTSYRQRDDA